jgi:hypothetical protein
MSLYTEDEARNKQCPFAFTSSGARQCVASDCMGWEFAPEGGRGRCVLIFPAHAVAASPGPPRKRPTANPSSS